MNCAVKLHALYKSIAKHMDNGECCAAVWVISGTLTFDFSSGYLKCVFVYFVFVYFFMHLENLEYIYIAYQCLLCKLSVCQSCTDPLVFIQ